MGLTYEEVLANPEKLAKFNRELITEENINESPLFLTWSSLTGRCTSFAVKVIEILNTRHPGMFDFKFYDVGRHRVARCQNTGVLIDSSSNVGAVVLKEDENWTSLEGISGRWNYIN